MLNKVSFRTVELGFVASALWVVWFIALATHVAKVGYFCGVWILISWLSLGYVVIYLAKFKDYQYRRLFIDSSFLVKLKAIALILIILLIPSYYYCYLFFDWTHFGFNIDTF